MPSLSNIKYCPSAALAALRDRAEYLLKRSPLSPPEEALPATGSGRKYHLAKKRRIQVVSNM